jgi:tetratricopeptide (TPR) repeat protein
MAKYHGEKHMLYASTLGQLALLYMNLGRADDAFATWQRSLDIYIAASANEEVVITLNAMGTMRRRQGKLDEALAIYERTRAAIAKFEQPNGRLMTDTQTRTGMVEIARKRYAEAIAVLEKALAARTAGGAVPSLVSWTRFELAQAVWELGRDRKRAVALAREAEAEAKQDNDADQIELIHKWLATHR